MNTMMIKTVLMKLLGQNLMSFVQGVRFVYLIKKRHEPDPEVEIIHKILNRGDTAIDVGANGANWTYYLHQYTGNTGQVYAFEADPYYAKASNYAIKLMRLKGIRFFQFGLSDKNEEVALRVTGSSGMRGSGIGYVDKKADKKDKGVEFIRLKSLDSIIQDHPKLLNTKLIKCDVEGYELFVFKGAHKILLEARPIVILEKGIGLYERHGYSGKEVYNFFNKMKYKPFAMTKNGHLSETDTNLNHKEVISVNRIMIPEEKSIRFSSSIESSKKMT